MTGLPAMMKVIFLSMPAGTLGNLNRRKRAKSQSWIRCALSIFCDVGGGGGGGGVAGYTMSCSHHFKFSWDIM